LSPAHPEGLFLSKVSYPFLNLPPRTAFTSILQKQAEDSWTTI
jgi:tRNA pseudouridine38-40 synthase